MVQEMNIPMALQRNWIPNLSLPLYHREGTEEATEETITIYSLCSSRSFTEIV